MSLSKRSNKFQHRNDVSVFLRTKTNGRKYHFRGNASDWGEGRVGVFVKTVTKVNFTDTSHCARQ